MCNGVDPLPDCLRKQNKRICFRQCTGEMVKHLSLLLQQSSPKDCFDVAFEAMRIAIEHMTPVFLLSDGYIGNGAEPWRFGKPKTCRQIKPPLIRKPNAGDAFLPYKRDEKGVRPWAIPGIAGLEHRIGGLEKEDLTGNVSYDPENHEKMVKLRAEKINKIALSYSMEQY